MKALLDTSVVIAAEMDSSPPDLDDLEVAISSITYAELEFGLHASATEQVRADRSAALTRIRAIYGPGIPFDDAVASSYGLLFGVALSRGKRSRALTADFQIAATAHLLGVPVVTRNLADFDVISDIVTVIQR